MAIQPGIMFTWMSEVRSCGGFCGLGGAFPSFAASKVIPNLAPVTCRFRADSQNYLFDCDPAFTNSVRPIVATFFVPIPFASMLFGTSRK